ADGSLEVLVGDGHQALRRPRLIPEAPVKLVVAAICFLLATSAMAAGSIAGYEYGGPAARFDAVVRQYNNSGDLFRIDGHCQSSCTLFLGIRNVCITPAASLLFHAAH